MHCDRHQHHLDQDLPPRVRIGKGVQKIDLRSNITLKVEQVSQAEVSNNKTIAKQQQKQQKTQGGASEPGRGE